MALNVRDVRFEVVGLWEEIRRLGPKAPQTTITVSGQRTRHDTIKDAEAYALATLELLDRKPTIIDPQVDVLQVYTYKTDGGKHRQRSETVRQYTPADLHTGLFAR